VNAMSDVDAVFATAAAPAGGATEPRGMMSG
jgi:hypothetical protein